MPPGLSLYHAVFEKASAPNDLNLAPSSKLIVVKAVFENAILPTVLVPAIKLIVVKFAHEEKAPSPIFSTEGAIMTSVNLPWV